MQFVINHASSVTGYISSRSYLISAVMWRDVNQQMLPSVRLNTLTGTDLSTESKSVTVGSIHTGGVANQFRDHNCTHCKFDGVLTANGYAIKGIDVSSIRYESYFRGQSSFLQTNIANMGPYAFDAALGKVYFLNYAYPRSWDQPDGTCYATNPSAYVLQVLQTVDVGGFRINIVYQGTFRYSGNYYRTVYNVLLNAAIRVKGDPETYLRTRKVQRLENADGWSPWPNPAGFDQEWKSMQAGTLPGCSLLPLKMSEFVAELQRECIPVGACYDCDKISISIPARDAIFDSLHEFTSLRMSKISYPDIQEFWQTEQSAIQDCKAVGINTIEFLKDIPVFGKELPQLIQTTKKIRSRKRALKAIADQYLALQYGSRLTISDAKNISKSMTRNNRAWIQRDFSKVYGRSVCNGTNLPSSVRSSHLTRCSKIYYCPEDSRLAKFTKGLFDLGMFPSSSTVWDLIPLSFVADWFTNAGDMFESADASYYATMCLDVLSVLSSDKYVTVFSQHPFCSQFSGDITRVDYHRTVCDKLHQPKLDFRFQTSYLNHVAELTAIVVSKR